MKCFRKKLTFFVAFNVHFLSQKCNLLFVPRVRASKWIAPGSFPTLESVKRKNMTTWFLKFFSSLLVSSARPVSGVLFTKPFILSCMGSGCGSVGRAVASNARGPRFESSHWQKNYLYIEHLFTVNCVLKRRK